MTISAEPLTPFGSCPLPGVAAPRIAFTTDAFAVRPLFFPGGDIGRLAEHGTVNDLAVGGARPLFLSTAFILEEGLPLADLKRIVDSMHQACSEANVALVTGDTKVVDRGKGDGAFITTSGIGIAPNGRSLSIHSARSRDCILVSGTLVDPGIAITSVREGLEFETVLESDTAALNGLTEAIPEACPNTRRMRDPTRGGPIARLWSTALAGLVDIGYIKATGHSVKIYLPKTMTLPKVEFEWKIPKWSNAIERNRARSYFQAYAAAALHFADKAMEDLHRGQTQTWREFKVPDNAIGCGFHEAVRGVLSHHVVIRIMRAVRSFDPCLPCGVHMYLGGGKELDVNHAPMFGAHG